MVGYNMDGPTRDRVMKLIQDKDRIENEIRQQTAILQNNNVGMDEPLVDQEGYPRNDVDVYKVRHARHQIICLQNDHKRLMKLIEKGLAEIHADLRGSYGEVPSVNAATSSAISNHCQINGNSSGDSINGTQQSFAVVGCVTDGSPADIAGLCQNDEILQFGSVNHENFTDMSQIMDIVSHSVGQRVSVKIRRDDNILNVTVVPRPWQQPGLLGCQILRKS